MTRTFLATAALIYFLGVTPCIGAQQTHVRAPLQRTQSGLYEHFNVGWRYSRQMPRGSMFFEFNSPALPPFGGYDPNADARFGAAQRWGSNAFSFQFTAGQGSSRTMTMSAPSVTSLNGIPASFQDVTMRPFVTGLIPVVGGFQMFPVPTFGSPPPVVISPLAGKIDALKTQSGGKLPVRRRSLDPARAEPQAPDDAEPVFVAPNRNSSAERGDLSVEEIRRQQSEEDTSTQQEISRLCAEARIAEVAGQISVARVRYQQAAARAKGQQRDKLLALVAKLKSQGDN